MEILIAQHSGFCEGVERAYRIALEQVKLNHPVYMLGNLVHNTQVVEQFINAGAKIIKTLNEVPDNSPGILLISAHGVSPEIYTEAKRKKLQIIDTTCPWVKKAQKIAKELSDCEKNIVIVGDKGHVEVKGLVGWSGGKAIVVENMSDVNSLSLPKDQPIGVLAQTTQSKENFNQVVTELKNRFNNVTAFDTICGATAKRQAAAVELAKKVDLLLVIGDKMSANTRRLTELCTETGTRTHQIQTVSELNTSWLDGIQKVGITAGASTPEWVIKAVVAKLA
ncbi:MAG: 4-hydroxy-3-methylbut-2-enyl diphosphate reductase [Candidatus Margulisiibacteriota bacterium]